MRNQASGQNNALLTAGTRNIMLAPLGSSNRNCSHWLSSSCKPIITSTILACRETENSRSRNRKRSAR